MELEPSNRDQIAMDTIHLSPRELYIMISNVERQIVMRLNMEKETRVTAGNDLARRLEDLNHAHEQAKEKEKDFLLRTEYNVQHAELERRVEYNGNSLLSLNYLPGKLDGLSSSVTVKNEDQDKRLSEIDKKIVSIYSYGFGASGALVVVSVLVNIAIHLIFK